MKKDKPFLMLVAVVAYILLYVGCAQKEGNKALFEASIGVAIGQSSLNDLQTKLSEGDISAVREHIFGPQDPLEGTDNSYSQPAGGNKVIVWINNSNGSQTKVVLTRNADGSYRGPKGERYPTMPTQTKLKQSYGL